MTQQDSAGTTPTELMDTDPVSRKFDDYLLDLERINVLMLAYRPTPLWLKRALADFPAEQPISALSTSAAPVGGMLRELRKWARGKNLKLDLARLLDGNPRAVPKEIDPHPDSAFAS